MTQWTVMAGVKRASQDVWDTDAPQGHGSRHTPQERLESSVPGCGNTDHEGPMETHVQTRGHLGASQNWAAVGSRAVGS